MISLELAKKLWPSRHEGMADIPEVKSICSKIEEKHAQADALMEEADLLAEQRDEIENAIYNLRYGEAWRDGFIYDTEFPNRETNPRYNHYNFISPHTEFSSRLIPLVNGKFEVVTYSDKYQRTAYGPYEKEHAITLAKDYALYGKMDIASIIE